MFSHAAIVHLSAYQLPFSPQSAFYLPDIVLPFLSFRCISPQQPIFMFSRDAAWPPRYFSSLHLLYVLFVQVIYFVQLTFLFAVLKVISHVRTAKTPTNKALIHAFQFTSTSHNSCKCMSGTIWVIYQLNKLSFRLHNYVSQCPVLLGISLCAASIIICVQSVNISL